jgi:hypothetical protein
MLAKGIATRGIPPAAAALRSTPYMIDRSRRGRFAASRMISRRRVGASRRGCFQGSRLMAQFDNAERNHQAAIFIRDGVLPLIHKDGWTRNTATPFGRIPPFSFRLAYREMLADMRPWLLEIWKGRGKMMSLEWSDDGRIGPQLIGFKRGPWSDELVRQLS